MIEKYKELRNTEVHTRKILLKSLGKGIRNKKLQDSAIYKLDKPYFIYTFFKSKLNVREIMLKNIFFKAE